MKIQITVDDEQEAKVLMQAKDMYFALLDLQTVMRANAKHAEDPIYEKMYFDFLDVLEAKNINLEILE